MAKDGHCSCWPWRVDIRHSVNVKWTTLRNACRKRFNKKGDQVDPASPVETVARDVDRVKRNQVAPSTADTAGQTQKTRCSPELFATRTMEEISEDELDKFATVYASDTLIRAHVSLQEGVGNASANADDILSVSSSAISEVAEGLVKKSLTKLVTELEEAV